MVVPVGLGIRVPDVADTLDRAEAWKANRLAQLVQQRAMQDRERFGGLVQQHGGALFGGDPAARRTALEALVRGGGVEALPLATNFLQMDMQRETPLSPQEVAALGLPRGAVVFRTGAGGYRVAHTPPQATPWTFVERPDGMYAVNPRDPSQVRKVEGVPGKAPTGVFSGDSVEAQALNIVEQLRNNPNDPRYALAYARLYGDQIVRAQDGSITIISRSPPAGFPQPTQQALRAADQVFGLTGRPEAPATPTAPGATAPGQDQQPESRTRVTELPGGGRVTTITPVDPREQQRIDAQRRTASVVVEDVNRAMDLANRIPTWTTGPIGAVLQSVPGTGAHDLSGLLNTIKSNIGFDKLQSMREASPTGGALGQVSDFENRQLQATFGELMQSQSADQFRHNLMRVKRLFLEIVHGPEAAARLLERDTQTPRTRRYNPQTGQLE